MDPVSQDVALISRIPAVPTILDVVCRTTGMGFAAVSRVTDSQWIACSVLDRIEFGLMPGNELELSSTFCHGICQRRQPVIIDHVAEDEIYRDHPIPLQYGFQSYISVPIILPDGKVFGTLCAIDPKPALLNTPAVVGMFTMFAQLIAFHIDAADNLAVKESELNAERENAMLREQFIAVLGHDLRSPLSAITLGVDLLKESELEEQTAALVQMMGQSAVRMFGLIDDVMDFARGRLGGGISLESKSSSTLQPLLEDVICEMRTIWPDRKIEARIALAESVQCDPRRLSQLFANLLANAMNHGKSEIPVSITASSGGGRFDLTVANASDPIPPGIRQRLFEPFSRGESDQNKQGLGLGLYIASQIAKSHGGSLEVDSTEEETKFTFSMPSAGPGELSPS
ncbi:MAG: GAF domain-containing sensor histidine kinase [Luteolibacter sp.]|uniref:GAF domain-containing sensor histidine kinase n=1 Tax=Luteolibacter sp. TaxID=1962973 RepID=UPI003266B169